MLKRAVNFSEPLQRSFDIHKRATVDKALSRQSSFSLAEMSDGLASTRTSDGRLLAQRISRTFLPQNV